jgi:HEAT repeat protein
MISSPYPPPVDRLLHLGDPGQDRTWPDYLALGLRPEHIADLIRLLQDETLNNADNESQEVWAPLHAWRALGQLRAEQAIEPLLGLLHRIDDSDDKWVGSELPEVFGRIGPAAIAPLEQYTAAHTNPTLARQAAADGLREIGQADAEARAEVVAALTRLLDDYAQPERDSGLNGFLISYLAGFGALEAAPLMERAFAAGVVDESAAGDWEDIQIGLGLKAERSAPRQRPTDPAYNTIPLTQQAVRPQANPASAQPPGPKRKHHHRKT